MDRFAYQDGVLHCEDVSAAELAARFGTPLYVYSQDTLLGHYDRLRSGFAGLDPLICFSVKSCQNIHLLRLLAERGSGFDVVSGGELHRAMLAGAQPAQIVYAGVGKSDREIREAIAAQIGLFNVESESELRVLADIARDAGVRVEAALRVNPDVDAGTHDYTTTGRKQTKFGIDIERAADVFDAYRAIPDVWLRGIHLHIGSPVNRVEPYAAALRRGLKLLRELRGRGHTVDTLDMGGGFGAAYEGNEAPSLADYAAVIVPLLRDAGLRVILEPGRSIAANAGVLLTRVVHVKESGGRHFAIVDASMTELLRPALYQAYHFIWPVQAGTRVPRTRGIDQSFDELVTYDVVGPVCESGDFLARGRALPPVARGDLLAVYATGAYGITMASQYNSRGRPAEVLVAGNTARRIRRRETYDDLVQAEQQLDSSADSV